MYEYNKIFICNKLNRSTYEYTRMTTKSMTTRLQFWLTVQQNDSSTFENNRITVLCLSTTG